MSFVELVLAEQYWDSIVYAGRLYLFHRDGTFRVINWDQLVAGLNYRRDLNGTFRLLLVQSDYLYAAFAPGGTREPGPGP